MVNIGIPCYTIATMLSTSSSLNPPRRVSPIPDPVAQRSSGKLLRISGFTITSGLALHRTEIVDRCPMRFLWEFSLASCVAPSCATRLTCPHFFDIAGFLLRPQGTWALVSTTFPWTLATSLFPLLLLPVDSVSEGVSLQSLGTIIL